MPINETLKFDVSWGGAVRASANATLVDKSLPAYNYILVPGNPSDTEITQIDVPVYTLTATATAINEGGTITFNLSTTKLDTGTVIPYTISGVSVADISLSALTGNFVTDAAGKASLTFNIINDVLTEGNETMTLTLSGKGVSRSVTINDTSGQPAYIVGWYSNATGTTEITNTNEDRTAYLVVKTAFVANGTVLSVTLSGTGINANDVSSGLTGTITIQNNIGSFAVPIRADRFTEGPETIIATLKNGATTLGTGTLIINDTSVTTTYSYNTYSAATGGTVIDNITEVASGNEIVININSSYGGISTVDEGYYIKPTINLFELFVSTQGRKPLKNEKVTFNVASNVAIIGNNTAVPALIVSHLWDSTNVLKLNNGGIISGRGGNSITWIGGYGGSGIDGGSAPLTVTNSGTISGGGGAGGCIGATGITNMDEWDGLGGGGGAPYGKGRKVRVTPGVTDTSGKDATLFKGGGGAYWPSTNIMSGGDMGKPGIDSSDIIENPGAAGKAYNGRVNITNTGAGKVLGS